LIVFYLVDYLDYIFPALDGPVKSVKRLANLLIEYINDPLNEELTNCEYVPDGLRSAVVATGPIQPGDELFVVYGDIYWKGQKGMGNILDS
jgi:hypothetical protein